VARFATSLLYYFFAVFCSLNSVLDFKNKTASLFHFFHKIIQIIYKLIFLHGYTRQREKGDLSRDFVGSSGVARHVAALSHVNSKRATRERAPPREGGRRHLQASRPHVPRAVRVKSILFPSAQSDSIIFHTPYLYRKKASECCM
jgi:hypothetical protein